jgi:hypothetical protein
MSLAKKNLAVRKIQVKKIRVCANRCELFIPENFSRTIQNLQQRAGFITTPAHYGLTRV